MPQANGRDIKGELRRFIVNNYLRGPRKFALSDDDSFLEKSVLDSIGVVELIAFIQNKYGARIKVSEIMPENFDTLNNLERYITGKLKRGGR